MGTISKSHFKTPEYTEYMHELRDSQATAEAFSEQGHTAPGLDASIEGLTQPVLSENDAIRIDDALRVMYPEYGDRG